MNDHVVGQRPLPGEIDLLELRNDPGRVDVLPNVAVARIEHLPRRRLPAHADVEQLGLRMIEVVLQRARGRPVVGKPAFAGQQQVGCIGGARRLGQRHALALEIVALADRKPRPLVAGGRIEQARGQRERELIGVADAIAAEIAVLGEQLRKVEIVDRGVERRDLVLSPVRYVDVESARLERLGVVAAEHVRFALEDQPAVEAGDRHRAIEVLFLHGAVVGEIVVAKVQAGARGHEPGVAARGPGRRRIEHRPLGVEQRRLAKAHVLGVGREIDVVPLHRVHRHQELRLAEVRRRDRVVGVLQRLERLHAREDRKRPAAVRQSRLARQGLLRRYRQPVGQVGEIRIVRNLLHVDVGGEPGNLADRLIVLPGQLVAVGVGDAVGQYRGVGLADDVGKKIAELAVDLQAAARHQARRQRRVVVRRQIEVVRQRHLDTAAAGRAEYRRQESRLALVGQRKIDERRVQDRHVLEQHRRIARRADQARAVDVDAGRGQVPVVVAGDAGRVADVLELVLVLAEKGQLPRVAARCILAEVKLRRGEEARLVAALEFRLRTGDPVDAAAHDDIAPGPELVGGNVVAQPVGEHGLPARAQFRVARRFDPLLVVAFELVGTQEDGLALRRCGIRSGTEAQRLRRRRLHHRRRFELRRR